MQRQLSRLFKSTRYYCELITKDLAKAKSKKNAAKYAGFKARIIKTSEGYGIFIS